MNPKYGHRNQKLVECPVCMKMRSATHVAQVHNPLINQERRDQGGNKRKRIRRNQKRFDSFM